ncbi:MAG: hypothetical protein KIS94_14445 [Chitinophagales bacterium]|nr:hypothetical protein [Chitinophagales bacterium]
MTAPEIEIHPFGNFIPAKATHLVLGSFPTHKRHWQFKTFYPGRANFFWRMLAEIYSVKFQHTKGEEAAHERLQLCADKRIALSDTIYSCSRKVAGSSKDSDLVVVEKMNVLKLLRENPSIQTVILTGSSGKVNAHTVFAEHLSQNNIVLKVLQSKPPIEGSFIVDGRVITTHTLYSTSGLNIGRYKQALEQYRSHLPK